MSIKDYYTLEAHSKAKKLPLTLPDGTDKGDHLMIVGVDSISGQEAKQEMYRTLASKEITQTEARNIWIQGFIESWSFDEECSFDNKIAFLANAPSIAESVDIFAANASNFSKKQKRS